MVLLVKMSFQGIWLVDREKQHPEIRSVRNVWSQCEQSMHQHKEETRYDQSHPKS